MLYRLLIFLYILLSPTFQVMADAAGPMSTRTIYMTSLEWPPYSGEKLNHQGASVAVAKSLFEDMGYELVVDFYPWSKAIKLGLDPSSKYVGYFPEYYAQSLDKKCNFSDSMGFSPLGFAHLKNSYVKWDTLDDIAKLSAIGTVKDYVNSRELDARIGNGNIKAIEAQDDMSNIKKLLSGELPLIVIDQHVLGFLLEELENNNKQHSIANSSIVFNEKLLEEKKLYLCFKKTKNAKMARDTFNQGIEKVNMRSFFNESLR